MVTTTPSDTPRTAETKAASKVHAPQRNFRIPGDKVRMALRDLPVEQRDDVMWFYKHCVQVDPEKGELGRILRKPSGGHYSANSIVQLLTGGRTAKGESTEAIHQAILGLRRLEEPRSGQVSSGFVETRLYSEIERRCNKALLRNRILFIFGDSQIGKTESLKEYTRRHNHGQTTYIEIPDGGSKGLLLTAMAEALDIRTTKRQTLLQDALLKSFDHNNLLILDEAHRFFEGRSKSAGLASLSFLRRLWNQTKCGMVLSMTNQGRRELIHGRHAKELEQMWRRRITPLQLPNVPPEDDAAKFAHAYGLDTAPDETIAVALTVVDERGREKSIKHQDNPLRLQREVLKTEGLGVWISILQDASDMAQAANRKVNWHAVLKAHAAAQADAEIYS